ncbi:uncharacterized protein LOC129229739 [Uloborus diversus]|uniref:uncharacterized protein LOC129229739 n=1 Tax=Uloborus diversus TaxID=327109 RepID=UPI002409D077|nr:uncharacterized protein LOC129229739 [Uloborus diversus]
MIRELLGEDEERKKKITFLDITASHEIIKGTNEGAMNKLNINVSYGGKKEIFNCTKQEIIGLIKKHFCLSGEVELYKRFKETKERIEPHNIKDLMAIEVELKKRTRSALNGHARFHEDYEIGEPSNNATYHELMIKKLLDNKTLNGKERMDVIGMIRNRKILHKSRKRKRKEKTPREEVPMLHKKLQVCLRDVKDSSAQTDPIRLESLNDSISEDDLIIKMKKMSCWNTKNIAAKKLMQKTFSERQRYIYSKRPPAKMTREIYPLLFSLEEVKNELERIFNFGKCREFLKNVQKFSGCILENARDTALCKIARKIIQKSETEEQSKYALQVGALLCLPVALREEASFLRLKNQANICGEYPYIHAPTLDLEDVFLLQERAVFKIVVEGITLCTTALFPEAILCLMASFYIFNINYTPATYRTYVAMEKLFLEGNETEEVDGFTSQLIKYFKLKAK